MTNEIKVKKELKVIIDSIVEKIEKEHEVFYLPTDSIVETIYCLILGRKINSVEEMKNAICKLLKSKLFVVA